MDTVARVMTGPELRAAREAASVRPADIARAMGVSRQRIRNLENMVGVPVEAADRYMVAVRQLSETGGQGA